MSKIEFPIVVYDNQCYLCVKFAKFVNFFSRGKFTMIGHYSDEGRKIRKQILDKSALDMFWFIDEGIAYGGRAALLPLIKAAVFFKRKRNNENKMNPKLDLYCKSGKAVFLRSASLICNSKKINFEDNLEDI